MTLLFVFDVGHSYLEPTGFEWGRVLARVNPRPGWSEHPGFPDAIKPPFRHPAALELAVTSELLRAARESIPWCDLTSVRFIFFLEGLAVLRVRAKLLKDARACKMEFDAWEDVPRPGKTEPEAYRVFGKVVADASGQFCELAKRAGLRTDFGGREPNRFYWIYPLFFTDGPDLYRQEEVLDGVSRLGGAKIFTAWRGARVASPEGWRAEVEAAFVAANLTWQAIYTLNMLLGRRLPPLVMKEGITDQELSQLDEIRRLQLFSSHLLDGSRLFRWTIRGDVVFFFRTLERVWETKQLRESVENQNGLATLVTTYYDKVEAKRSQEWERNLKTFGAIIAVFSFISAAVNVIKTASDDYPNLVVNLIPAVFYTLGYGALVVAGTYGIGVAWSRGRRKLATALSAALLLGAVFLDFRWDLSRVWPRTGFVVLSASVFVLWVYLWIIRRPPGRPTG